jgi:DNA polymerase III gamma/tau subunit
MKSLALAVVMAGVLAAAGGVTAQQAPSSPPDSSQTPAQSSQAPAESKNTNVEINVGSPARPSTEAPSAAPAPPSQAETRVPDAKNGNKANTQTDSSKDDVSALPRAAASSDRSQIFGLSPVTAVVIAAALLVVVILAIVAMTRSNDTYIDTNRGI